MHRDNDIDARNKALSLRRKARGEQPVFKEKGGELFEDGNAGQGMLN